MKSIQLDLFESPNSHLIFDDHDYSCQELENLFNQECQILIRENGKANDAVFAKKEGN